MDGDFFDGEFLFEEFVVFVGGLRRKFGRRLRVDGRNDAAWCGSGGLGGSGTIREVNIEGEFMALAPLLDFKEDDGAEVFEFLFADTGYECEAGGV